LVIEIIEMKTKSRIHGIRTPVAVSENGNVYTPASLEVTVGRATIFVTNVERFEKI